MGYTSDEFSAEIDICIESLNQLNLKYGAKIHKATSTSRKDIYENLCRQFKRQINLLEKIQKNDHKEITLYDVDNIKEYEEINRGYLGAGENSPKNKPKWTDELDEDFDEHFKPINAIYSEFLNKISERYNIKS